MLTEAKGWIRLASAGKRIMVTERVFRAKFGLPSEVLPLLWFKLASMLHSSGQKAIHLLWTLFWLKVYPTDDVCADTWGVTANTFNLHRLTVLDVMHSTLNEVRLISMLSVVCCS